MRGCTADVLGLDWSTDMAEARSVFGAGSTLQGNVDPVTLFGTEEVITQVRSTHTDTPLCIVR